MKSFKATIHDGHKGPAVEVPFDPAREWSAKLVVVRPGRRGYAAQAVLNGLHFDSFVVARSNRFWLLLDDAKLRATSTRIGDVVNVTVAPAP